MSATQSRSGAVGAKLRLTRSRARSAAGVRDGGALGLPAHRPGQSVGLHEPLHGAAGYLDALAVEVKPHLRAPYTPQLSAWTRRI